MPARPAPAYTVYVQAEAPVKGRVPPASLRRAARAALDHQAAARPGALTIRLTDDETLRQLNRDYLGHDYATDVLSFPSEAYDEGTRYFGDLAIALPRAEAQARAGGHPLEAELQLLVVHGVLHLLGHDHATRLDKARMWAAQAEILTKLGAPITGPAPINQKPRPPQKRGPAGPH